VTGDRLRTSERRARGEGRSAGFTHHFVERPDLDLFAVAASPGTTKTRSSLEV
jgi:hypothetical protein